MQSSENNAPLGAHPSAKPANSIFVGKVGKAHGIKGEMYITLFAGVPDAVQRYKNIFLFVDGALMDEALCLGIGNNFPTKASPVHTQLEGLYNIVHARKHGRRVIVSLATVHDRNGAEALEGMEVWAQKTDLPILPSDEFYWHEMVGMSVGTDDGRDLGVVTSVFATGAHDVFVITSHEGQEYLIPAVKAFVREIDQRNKRLVVIPVEGLLEINIHGNAI